MFAFSRVCRVVKLLSVTATENSAADHVTSLTLHIQRKYKKDPLGIKLTSSDDDGISVSSIDVDRLYSKTLLSPFFPTGDIRKGLTANVVSVNGVAASDPGRLVKELRDAMEVTVQMNCLPVSKGAKNRAAKALEEEEGENESDESCDATASEAVKETNGKRKVEKTKVGNTVAMSRKATIPVGSIDQLVQAVALAMHTGSAHEEDDDATSAAKRRAQSKTKSAFEDEEPWFRPSSRTAKPAAKMPKAARKRVKSAARTATKRKKAKATKPKKGAAKSRKRSPESKREHTEEVDEVLEL